MAYEISKELAYELKKRDIKCISTQSDMSKRLKFYGIGSCKNYRLRNENLNIEKDNKIVTISYKFRPIYKASVTNLYTK